MNNKNTGPFRKSLANFIRIQRKYRSNKDIKEMIYPFCCGWTSLSDEMDEIFLKYETQQYIDNRNKNK